METVVAGSKSKVSARHSGPIKGDPLHSPSYEVYFQGGERRRVGEGDPSFTIVVDDADRLNSLLRADAYTAGLAFIRGDFDIWGDLVSAVRFHTENSGRGAGIFRSLPHLASSLIESWYQRRSRAAKNVRFHYDKCVDFYRQFLDPRLVYSCAYFEDAGWPLERAQLAKLDHICRKLDLHPGERFLDVGCGWGALVFRAAEHYGARATGCTLSPSQAEFARSQMARLALGDDAVIYEADYRTLRDRFRKIASVGMFEHVGRRRLGGYFRKIHELLEDDGLFLNHGIMRPQRIGDDAETLLVRRRVFPGGELAHLSDVAREAENAGFEVLDVENLRPHYALTCRAWVERLRRNAGRCLQLVDKETYRTWLLHLAASARNFEDGLTDVYQMLLAKRRHPSPRRLTRRYMYE